MPHCTRKRQRAFTLVEVLIVLLIFGVLITMAAVITRAVTAAQKRSLTATRMATVEAALVQFVLQQRRLPCPANGTTPATNTNAGEEMRSAGACSGSQQHGMVPWRALALTETDVTDGWDRRLTYRVSPVLAADAGMDMSACDPAGSAAGVGGNLTCNTLCTSAMLVANCTSPANFLSGKGLEVRDASGAVLMNPAVLPTMNTGAAYVVISHGESGGGAYLSTGVLATSTVVDGTEEARNYANLVYTAGVTYYVDSAIIETSGVSHFDDIVLRPSILNVVSKAGLQARAH